LLFDDAKLVRLFQKIKYLTNIYVILTFNKEMKKKLIRMTEGDIQKMVTECVSKLIKENYANEYARNLVQAIQELGPEGFVNLLCSELPSSELEKITFAGFKAVAKKNGTYDEAYGPEEPTEDF
jgi:hypothetical protein